jgi:hypothetical protein
MQKNRSLKNALNESPDRERERVSVEESTHERQSEKKEETADGDVIGVLLRGITAFFMAVFFSAVVSGMLEVFQGWEITFGSLPMIVTTSVLYYPCYKILSRMDFFRKNPD